MSSYDYHFEIHIYFCWCAANNDLLFFFFCTWRHENGNHKNWPALSRRPTRSAPASDTVHYFSPVSSKLCRVFLCFWFGVSWPINWEWCHHDPSGASGLTANRDQVNVLGAGQPWSRFFIPCWPFALFFCSAAPRDNEALVVLAFDFNYRPSLCLRHGHGAQGPTEISEEDYRSLWCAQHSCISSRSGEYSAGKIWFIFSLHPFIIKSIFSQSQVLEAVWTHEPRLFPNILVMPKNLNFLG